MSGSPSEWEGGKGWEQKAGKARGLSDISGDSEGSRVLGGERSCCEVLKSQLHLHARKRSVGVGLC